MQQHFLFRLAAGIKYGLKRRICSFDNEEKTYFNLLKNAAVREAFINVQSIAIPVNWIWPTRNPLKDSKAAPTVTITDIKQKLKVGPKLSPKTKQAHECSSKMVILTYVAYLKQEQLQQGTTRLNCVLNETALIWHNCIDIWLLSPASWYRQDVNF